MVDPNSGESGVDLLAFIIVTGSQSEALIKALKKKKFQLTVIDSTAGIIQDSVKCLLIGLNHIRMPLLKNLLKQYCTPYQKFIPTQIRGLNEYATIPMIEAEAGGFTFYTLAVERFMQI